LANEQEVAARLALAAQTRLLKLERLRLAADELFAVETCYLPAEEFAEITRSTAARGSLFSILETGYGIEIAYADEEIDATAVTPATANLLGVAGNEPLLRIRQVIYSTKGESHALCPRPVSI
jgi:GntR family transcriptional regulator